MKLLPGYAYLRSDKAIQIQVIKPYLMEALGHPITVTVLSHHLIACVIHESERALLENFLAVYLQENHVKVHVLITYRQHPLGELASKIGLQKNPGKVDDLSDIVLQLILENRRDLLPLIQTEFAKVPRHLILTAMTLLTSDMNATKASEALYIHRNTFAYRLNQFITLTGLDIRRHRHALFFTLVHKLMYQG